VSTSSIVTKVSFDCRKIKTLCIFLYNGAATKNRTFYISQDRTYKKHDQWQLSETHSNFLTLYECGYLVSATQPRYYAKFEGRRKPCSIQPKILTKARYSLDILPSLCISNHSRAIDSKVLAAIDKKARNR
jgi:hypothetical protein